MGSACAYWLSNPSQAVFADEESKPAWTFGAIFIKIVDRACASSSSHLVILSMSVVLGLGILSDTYGHNLAPFR